MEGIAPIIVLVVIFVFVVPRILRAKKDAQDQQNAQNTTRPSVPPPRPPVPPTRTQVQPRPAQYTPTVRTVHQESYPQINTAGLKYDRNYAKDSINSVDTINSYSMQQLGYTTNFGVARMSTEEKKKWREELRSLYEAGIIERAEYESKMIESQR